MVQRVSSRAEGEPSWQRIVERYAAAHQLSRQELRLLLGIIEGRSDKSIAADWGRSRSTVSTYWKRIFAKTGQRPQREVLAHVLRFTAEFEDAEATPLAEDACSGG